MAIGHNPKHRTRFVKCHNLNESAVRRSIHELVKDGKVPADSTTAWSQHYIITSALALKNTEKTLARSTLFKLLIQHIYIHI